MQYNKFSLSTVYTSAISRHAVRIDVEWRSKQKLNRNFIMATCDIFVHKATKNRTVQLKKFITSQIRPKLPSALAFALIVIASNVSSSRAFVKLLAKRTH